ncbi:MAG TPA: hypothetical protein PLZ08_10075 [Bacillota bacterium]|jgi:hypothetical protein|nr:hypothetical protein [Bacillota bacterium]HOL10582.1 hypothetical protein [Bacillota bacterium]HPO98284.1 hypothetical protein [Bacillota bacterium]
MFTNIAVNKDNRITLTACLPSEILAEVDLVVANLKLSLTQHNKLQLPEEIMKIRKLTTEIKNISVVLLNNNIIISGLCSYYFTVITKHNQYLTFTSQAPFSVLQKVSGINPDMKAKWNVDTTTYSYITGNKIDYWTNINLQITILSKETLPVLTNKCSQV